MPAPTSPAAIVLIATLVATVPAAGNAAEPRMPETAVRDYDGCMRLVRETAETALEAALAWERKGGGYSARHCAAMALAAIGNVTAAADQLESLAWEMPPETPDEIRADLLSQAGQFWFDAQQPAKADALLSAAVDLAPGNPEIRIDRAMVFAAIGRLQDAIIDLSASILGSAKPVQALVLRASAYRQTGRTAEAGEDLERALSLAPGDAGALLERGLLRRETNDKKGARADWLAVLKHHPGSPAAESARRHLTAPPAGRRGKTP